MADVPNDPVAWRNSRPGKRMAAGAVIRDGRGRVLLVKPAYKDGWELPGGSTEADESPRESCRRELLEELGIDLEPGRLLCLEWQPPEPDRTESLMFLYDGGVTGQQEFTLPPDELEAVAFVAPGDLDDHLVPRLARRLRAALTALEDGRMAEMKRGHVVGTT